MTQETAVDTVILLCPCCASTVDARAGLGEQTFTCETCGQIWQMWVDADRFAEYALS